MSTFDHEAPADSSSLPADVARCAGYWADGDLRDGCDDCLRRTSPCPTERAVWVTPPSIVVFECELRIAPCPQPMRRPQE